MAEPSPARLFSTLVGSLLALLGVIGFFYSASFGSPGQVDEALGALAVNGWANVVHLLSGVAGLLLASFAPRGYAKWLGVAYLGLAAWGFGAGDGGTILGLIPANAESSALHAAIGALGLAAARATPALGPDPAGQGA